MTAAAIGRQMNGSSTNPIRLSLYSAKPALLNERHRVEERRYHAARPASSRSPHRNAGSAAPNVAGLDDERGQDDAAHEPADFREADAPSSRRPR